MKCPKCRSEFNVKSGIIKGAQRYKCKICGYNYTVERKSTAKHESIKRFALMLYMEGLGYHSIARLLNVSHVAVLNWVNKYGTHLELLNNNSLNVIGLGESNIFIGFDKIFDEINLPLVTNKKS